MGRMRLGIRLESLGLPIRRGLQEIHKLGVGGVQVDAVGDLAPRQLSQTGRREFGNLLRANNLELTALGCPFRHGFDISEGLQERIDRAREVMSLSFDLGARRVIVQAGRVPAPDETANPYLVESLLALGQHGDRVGSVLALETGLDAPAHLAAFLDRFDTGGLAVNLDPANLLLHGHDPYEAVAVLQRRLAHVHAKDACRAAANRAAQEVPLGHGDLDWLRLLDDLNDIDYRGWLVIEREAGSQRLADVTSGVAFLRRLIP
jgi:sugar phosphate isomerase/epimerase